MQCKTLQYNTTPCHQVTAGIPLLAISYSEKLTWHSNIGHLNWALNEVSMTLKCWIAVTDNSSPGRRVTKSAVPSLDLISHRNGIINVHHDTETLPNAGNTRWTLGFFLLKMSPHHNFCCIFFFSLSFSSSLPTVIFSEKVSPKVYVLQTLWCLFGCFPILIFRMKSCSIPSKCDSETLYSCSLTVFPSAKSRESASRHRQTMWLCCLTTSHRVPSWTATVLPRPTQKNLWWENCSASLPDVATVYLELEE